MLWQNALVFLIVGCAFGWFAKEYLLPQAIVHRLTMQWRQQKVSLQNKNSNIAIVPMQQSEQRPGDICSRCSKSGCHQR